MEHVEQGMLREKVEKKAHTFFFFVLVFCQPEGPKGKEKAQLKYEVEMSTVKV
jgi:hypothetical protein